MNPNSYENLRWQTTEDGLRIVRVYGNQSEIILPEQIQGKPVTEIGAYCFSARQRSVDGETFLLEGIETAAPAVCGNDLIKVTLPSSITTLHNAAFYNCRNLVALSFGSKITSIGSDEFTNCRNLKHLYLRESPDTSSGLKLLLERLESDIYVHFLVKGQETCVLFFPEYYEWLDEISPAHLFSRSIHGEGYRMRKSFQGQTVDFKKYDACFKNALATETDLTLCEIAFWRLKYPVLLEEAARRLYQEALLCRAEIFGKHRIHQKNTSDLKDLLQSFSLSLENLSFLLEECQLVDWPEGSVLVMQELAKRKQKKTKIFDFDL